MVGNNCRCYHTVCAEEESCCSAIYIPVEGLNFFSTTVSSFSSVIQFSFNTDIKNALFPNHKQTGHYQGWSRETSNTYRAWGLKTRIFKYYFTMSIDSEPTKGLVPDLEYDQERPESNVYYILPIPTLQRGQWPHNPSHTTNPFIHWTWH